MILILVNEQTINIPDWEKEGGSECFDKKYRTELHKI